MRLCSVKRELHRNRNTLSVELAKAACSAYTNGMKLEDSSWLVNVVIERV